jgi:L-fuconolactonase
MEHRDSEVIDAHQHFIDRRRFAYPWIAPDMTELSRPWLREDLLEAMRAAGVGLTVAVQASTTVQESLWYLEMSRRCEWIAGVVAWADIRSTELQRQVDDYRAVGKLVGIRCCRSEQQPWFLADDAVRGLRKLRELGIPFELLVRPGALAGVARLAAMVPDLPMVIDHIAKPAIAAGQLSPWREDLSAAAKFPNIYCKLSGMVTEGGPQWTAADLRPFVQHAIEAFGPERLMFGSDWPVCLRAAGSYKQVVEATKEAIGPLSAAESARLWGQTARDFYGLG